MIVDRISEPENIVQKARFLDACRYMEELDFDVIAAAEVEGEVLCLRLREVGGVSTSLVAVPLKYFRAVLKEHIEKAVERMPEPPQGWPGDFAEMAEKPLTPKVGVGVMLTRVVHEQLKEGYVATRGVSQVLLGLRKGSHGAGEWSFPGGHLELGETPEGCTKRELMGETGIAVKELTRIGWSNDVMPDEGLHYVTLFLAGDVPGTTEAQLLEPDKCEEWRWFRVGGKLPENIFGPTRKAMEGESR